MALLDKANQDVRIWPVVQVSDGYRSTRPGTAKLLPDGSYDPPEGTPIDVKAFIIPTGFAGAGWASNMRYEDQGWATVARATFLLKVIPGLELARWTRLEAQGFEWTIVDHPRYQVWRRTEYWAALAEVRGEDDG